MNRVLIIAEAGVNHNGDIEIAKRLVDEAKNAGADIVKFQTFIPRKLASKHATMAEYQKVNLGIEESQEAMLEKLSLERKDYVELASYCKQLDILFLSTPFDLESVYFLDDLQDFWKIPSGEITNYPYLVEIAKTGKDVILSTGMSTMDEVRAAWDILNESGVGNVTLMHCTTEYPAPYKEVNLKAMQTLRDAFHCRVGYSDHTKGIEVPIAAVAMGAEVIEKHFTLDRAMEGPDHKASLEPHELKNMVDAIRNIESALGSGEKKPSNSELKNRDVVRKSIVAARNIKFGEKFTEENLTTKRPGNGINPMKWEDILGTKANRDYSEDELIEI
ncbi:MAG: N-acetylneuraminate synthase [Lachnospiraceae bacterium]|nr:N-acetylneuraminate synthase [Lachnospiraceae bacterium]